jgi:SagB-type dehydrogenase family enzyme
VGGLAPGLYHFSPADLKLRALRPGDFRVNIASAADARGALGEARAILILSTIFWRSTWKYRARAYRYCFWDSGTMLANLLAAARAEGLGSEVVTAFVDAQIETLIGADGEHEGVACAVALGKTAPACAPADAADAIAYESLPLSPSEATYPELVRVHRESRLASTDEVRAIARGTASNPRPSIAASNRGLGLGETILRRGATRAFSHEALPVEDLREILAASTHHPAGDFAPTCEAYLIVNAVDGIDAGAYFHDRASGRLELIKRGEFRGNAGYLCLEQPIGADCGVLICYMANLDRVLAEFGNRGYRDVHLEAGLMGGRAWLASFALGHGATGLTFYDDDTSNFFGSHAGGKSPILMVAIGSLSGPHS